MKNEETHIQKEVDPTDVKAKEQAVADVIKLLKDSDDFLVLALKEREVNEEKGTKTTQVGFSTFGSVPKLFEYFNSVLKKHPELKMLFQLVTLKGLIRDKEEDEG